MSTKCLGTHVSIVKQLVVLPGSYINTKSSSSYFWKIVLLRFLSWFALYILQHFDSSIRVCGYSHCPGAAPPPGRQRISEGRTSSTQWMYVSMRSSAWWHGQKHKIALNFQPASLGPNAWRVCRPRTAASTSCSSWWWKACRTPSWAWWTPWIETI